MHFENLSNILTVWPTYATVWTIIVDPMCIIWMLYTKHESSRSCSFGQYFFFNCIFKPTFWSRDLLMQPTGTVWTTLLGDHPIIIPVKFGQNPMSGFRGEDVKMLTDD